MHVNTSFDLLQPNQNSSREPPVRYSSVPKRTETQNFLSFEESKQFQKAQGKSRKIKTLIGYPKIYQLEEKHKRGPVFNGDSDLCNQSLSKLHKNSCGVDKIKNESEAMSKITAINKYLRGHEREELENLSKEHVLSLLQKKQDDLTKYIEFAEKKGTENYKAKNKIYEGEHVNMVNSKEKYQLKEELKHVNQLNLILKNRLEDLNNALQEADRSKSGYVNFSSFEEVIKKLMINEKVLTDHDIKILFRNYQADPLKVDYRVLLQRLKDFNYDCKQQTKFEKLKRSNTVDSEIDIKRNSLETVNIIDCKFLHYNKAINYFKKSQKVAKAIRRLLPTESDLSKYLTKILSIPKEKIEINCLTQKDIKTIFNTFIDEFDVKYLSYNDFEGFFSSILYNKKGFTNFRQLVNTIYEEKEENFFKKIQLKVRGPPPQNPDISFDDQVPIKQSDEKQRENDSSGSLIKKEEMLNVENQDNFERNLETLLNNIEKKIFFGKKSAFKVFKEFDIDDDGYVSHTEFIKKLEEAKLIKKEEISKLLDYIDPEHKGYLNFNEFHRKIRPNMVNDDENGQPMRKTISSFSKPDFENENKTAGMTKTFFQNLKKQFDPESFKQDFFKKKGKTRSGANPAWVNTFLNFQSQSGTSLFVSEEDRLNRDSSKFLGFQTDDKNKKNSRQDQRIRKIRENQNSILTLINERKELLEKREESNLKKKFMSQTYYEKVISYLFCFFN